jgi:hypothetical protein
LLSSLLRKQIHELSLNNAFDSHSTNIQKKKKGFYFVFIDRNTIKLSVPIIKGGHMDKIKLVVENDAAWLSLFF